MPMTLLGGGGGGEAAPKFSLDHSFADGMGPFTGGVVANYHIVAGELHPNVVAANDMAIWIPDQEIANADVSIVYRMAEAADGNLGILFRLRGQTHYLMAQRRTNGALNDLNRLYRTPGRGFSADANAAGTSKVIATYSIRAVVRDTRLQLGLFESNDPLGADAVHVGNLSTELSVVTHPTLGGGELAKGSIGIWSNDFSAARTAGPWIQSIRIREL